MKRTIRLLRAAAFLAAYSRSARRFSRRAPPPPLPPCAKAKTRGRSIPSSVVSSALRAAHLGRRGGARAGDELRREGPTGRPRRRRRGRGPGSHRLLPEAVGVASLHGGFRRSSPAVLGTIATSRVASRARRPIRHASLKRPLVVPDHLEPVHAPGDFERSAVGLPPAHPAELPPPRRGTRRPPSLTEKATPLQGGRRRPRDVLHLGPRQAPARRRRASLGAGEGPRGRRAQRLRSRIGVARRRAALRVAGRHEPALPRTSRKLRQSHRNSDPDRDARSPKALPTRSARA